MLIRNPARVRKPRNNVILLVDQAQGSQIIMTNFKGILVVMGRDMDAFPCSNARICRYDAKTTVG
jgi:hypothetical protein